MDISLLMALVINVKSRDVVYVTQLHALPVQADSINFQALNANHVLDFVQPVHQLIAVKNLLHLKTVKEY
jgi:hypothetical protein